MSATSPHTTDDHADNLDSRSGSESSLEGPVDWLKTDPAPGPEVRSTNLNVRLRPADRERLDRSAKVLGLSTSEYVRERVLDGGPDVRAWRRAYQVLLETVELAERMGVSKDVAELHANLQAQFEDLAATVFPKRPQ